MHRCNIAILFLKKKVSARQYWVQGSGPWRRWGCKDFSFQWKQSLKCLVFSQSRAPIRYLQEGVTLSQPWAHDYFQHPSLFHSRQVHIKSYHTFSQSQVLLNVIMVHHKVQEPQSQYKNTSQRKIPVSACAMHKANGMPQLTQLVSWLSYRQLPPLTEIRD